MAAHDLAAEGDYCAKCHRFCPTGTSRPFTEDKRYRACPRCIAEMVKQAEALAREEE